MFSTECRLFIKHKKIFALSIIFSAGILLWGIRTAGLEDYEAVMSLLRTIEIAKYSFIFFMVLSYLYIEENCRDGIVEVIAAATQGKLKASLYKIMVLQIGNCILTVFFFFLNIWLAMQEGRGGNEYIRYIIELWILYFTLPNFLASLFGLCFAGLRNKRVGYVCMILFSYIFAGGFVNFLQMMSQKTEIIYRVADFFCIFARGTRRAVNYYYLIPVEGNNWLRVLLWLFLLGILLLYLFGAMGRKRKVVVFGVVFAGIFILYIRPYGGVYEDDFITGHDEWSADQYYYRLFQYEGKEEQAKFKVSEYDMKLTFGRELSVEVSMKPDAADLEKYAFTLYHGYRVKSVRDKDGNALPYVRDRDYIWVENETGHLEEIHICYAGHSLNFYSTSQGIRLPAYFAYYPVAGCRKIFHNETNEYRIKDKDDVSHFHLTLEAPEPVFCSLEQQEDGSYDGNAEGITIFGSRFAKCFVGDGYRIVYSGLEHSEEEMKECDKRVIKLGASKDPVKVIFLDAFTMYEHFYADAEQMIIFDFALDEEYGIYRERLKEDRQYD